MILVSILALAAPGAAAGTVRSVVAVPRPQPGWFLCDAVDGPVSALVGARGADGMATIMLVPAKGRPVARRYAVGRGDPGMGQVHYALSRKGRAAGDLHMVSPSMIGPPSVVRTPPFTSIRVEGRSIGCRWVENTRFAGLDARRGVLVTAEGGTLVYRSFDRDRPIVPVAPDGVQRTSRATTTVRGGRETRAADGATLFDFAAPGGWRYRIRVPAGVTPATLTVLRGGRAIQTGTLLGYTLSTR